MNKAKKQKEVRSKSVNKRNINNINNLSIKHKKQENLDYSKNNQDQIKVKRVPNEKIKKRKKTPLKNNSNIENKDNISIRLFNKKIESNNLNNTMDERLSSRNNKKMLYKFEMNNQTQKNLKNNNQIKKNNKVNQANKIAKESKKGKSDLGKNKDQKQNNEKGNQSGKDVKENKEESDKEVIDEKDEKLNDIGQNNNSFIQKNEDLNQIIKEKDEEIKKLEQLNLDNEKKIEELNSQIDLLRKENNDLTKSKSKKMISNSQMNSHKKGKNDLTKNESKINILNSQIDSLKKENKDLTNKIKELNSKIDSLKKENDDLIKSKSKIKELNSKIDSLKKENKDLTKHEDKIKELSSQIESLKKEKIDLITKNESKMKELNSQIEKENKDLNSKYESKIKELNSKIDSLKKENKDLNSKHENAMKTQIKSHKKENFDSSSIYENKTKTQIISHKKENIDSSPIYENKIKELNSKIESINKDNNDLTSRNDELQIENIRLQTENKNLNEKLAKIKKINPFILYNSPTLIGLNNIGATCFMNSTLQCLSQTKPLTNYFLNENNKDRIINNNIASNNKNDIQLSPIYLELIQKLWEIDGPKSFSPKTFMNTVEKMNPLFKQGQAGDAKDFIIFILEQLHKELKQSNNIINQNGNQVLNQYDKNSALNYFFSDFQKEVSIISDIFFGFNETANECLNCKNIYNSQFLINPICYNYGIFNCLIFPLEEVKNMKNNQMQQYNNMQINNNRVTIIDCFYYNQKTELFTGENRNFCNICKQLFDSNYISKIFVSPNILVIILNRGRGNIYDVKIDFSEIIDITQFVQQRDCPQLIYNLYGVITHIGQSGPNAHFVASCKSPIDNKWYRYNDAFVNPIINLQKEVIEFGTPYILFYQKNNS